MLFLTLNAGVIIWAYDCPLALRARPSFTRTKGVSIEVDNGRVIITPLETKLPSLEQRLAQFDASRHGGEVMVDRQRGAETW